jgi:import inner membrane translocase subunit TIM21
MIVEATNKRDGVPMTFEEKVKETGKSMWYGGVMLIGLAALATIAWTMWQELFASDSPNNIYSDSYRLVKSSTEVQDALGTPITCHGEQTRRGWRRHVLHHEFIHNNVKYLRMKYYLKGKFRTATVNLEKKANTRGRYDKYTYLIVELDGYPSRQIEVETDDV